MGPPVRSNPTARRGRNYLDFFQNFHEHRDVTVHILYGTQYIRTHIDRQTRNVNPFRRKRRSAGGMEFFALP